MEGSRRAAQACVVVRKKGTESWGARLGLGSKYSDLKRVSGPETAVFSASWKSFHERFYLYDLEKYLFYDTLRTLRKLKHLMHFYWALFSSLCIISFSHLLNGDNACFA